MFNLDRWKSLIGEKESFAVRTLKDILTLSDGHTAALFGGLKDESYQNIEKLIDDLQKNRKVLLVRLRSGFSPGMPETDETFRSLLLFLYAVALANAVAHWNDDTIRHILEKAIRALWPSNKKVVVTLLGGDDGLTKLDGAFRELYLSGCDVGALWDITLFLCRNRLQQTGARLLDKLPPTTRLTVMGVTEHGGLLGALKLEWLPEPEGSPCTEVRLQRHPATLLVPCDAAFRSALDTGLGWAKTSAPGPGVVRWSLSMGDRAIGNLVGNSMGAAFAIGLCLLWKPEEGDPGIAITGSVDESGTIGTVAGIIPKLRAALDIKNMAYDITLYLLPPGEIAGAGTLPVKPLPVTSVDDAVEKVLAHSGPRRRVREKIHKDSAVFPLLGKEDQEFHNQADRTVDASLHIPLPLLKEIPKEKLDELEKLRKEGARGRDRDDLPDSESTFPNTISVMRYEEYLALLESARYEPPLLPEETLERMTGTKNDSGARMVILGPPGCGKTTLLNWVAWRLTDREDALLSRSKTYLPVPVRLKEWEANKPPKSATYPELQAYLAGIYGEDEKIQWHQWLHVRCDVLLLLDGLDEVPAGFLEHVQKELQKCENLQTHNRCPVVISCRTVSRDCMQDIGCSKDVPVYTPGLISPEQRQVYVQNYPFANRRAPDDLPTILSEMEQPAYSLMVTNPLLLSILCFVADDENGAPLPRTRSGLYEKAVDKLLTKQMPKQLGGKISYGEPYVDADMQPRFREVHVDADTKRRILERCALTTMEAGLNADEAKHQPSRTSFKEVEISEHLRQAIAAEDAFRPTQLARYASDLLKDFRLNSALLMGQEGGDYGFLHLTFHEFLAASALARDAEKAHFEDVGDWEGSQWQVAFHHIDTGRSPLTPKEQLLANLDRRAWLPEWREVILFLAGKLEDPLPLLQLLGDIKISRDDYFRHRLEVAVFACREVEDLLPPPNGAAHVTKS